MGSRLYRYATTVPFSADHVRHLEEIPGIRVVAPTVAVAPENAAWLLEDRLRTIGAAARLVASPRSGRAWRPADLEGIAELRPWVPGYLTAYQRDGILYALPREGSLLAHPTGCLAGDTEITVNRRGCARRMTLRDLVAKFNGAETRGRRWDSAFPTLTQSNVSGFLRLNQITAAYESGVREVFEIVTRGGRRLRATASHHFHSKVEIEESWAWRPLEALAPGMFVAVARSPEEEKGARGGKRKPQYLQTQGMRHHPHADHVEIRRTPEWLARHGFRNPKTEQVWRVPTHRLVVEAGMNGLTFEAFVARLRAGDTFGLKFLPADVHVHHKDENTKNNAPENLEVLAGAEHGARHGRDGGWRHVTARVVEDEILSITLCGEEPTYDLSMADPHNNFIANGIVVHNSGKTLESTVWALAEPGPILVVTKAANRRSFALDVEKHTTVKPVVLIPESERKRKKDPPIVIDPLHPPRMVIVAWESLTDFQEQLLALAPVSLVLDEIHMCGKSGRRFEKIPVVTDDGQSGVEFRRLNNRATAIERIARNCKRRLGLSATPIPDRVRDLWAPLDLLDPKGFGPRWGRGGRGGFYNRYCDAHENNFGSMDTRGRSNVRELVLRLKFLMHVVDYATTHHDLPPKRRQISYLPKGQQDRPGAFAKELKAALKVESPGLRKFRVIEIRAAEAASRKRRSIIERAVSTLAAGGKVVIFTGRKADCERLATALEAAAPKGSQVWHGHGGHPPARRDEIRELYMAAQGPAALVGTMQSWGESLNLHDTDHAIFAMLPVTPRELWQAEGRFARRGMKRPVLIEYVIAEGTVDEQISALLLDKLPAVEEIQGDSEMGAASRDLASGGLSEEQITERLAEIVLRPVEPELDEISTGDPHATQSDRDSQPQSPVGNDRVVDLA